MKPVIKIKPDSNYAKSLSASIILHLLLFIITAMAFKMTIENSRTGSKYIQLNTKEIGEEKQIISTAQTDKAKVDLNPRNKIQEKERAKTRNEATNLIPLSAVAADTSRLQQIYKESTLNVSIRYPVGWTYLDQDVKKKLDGVTFWSTDDVYSPPPYIHLEVKEKYLFDPQRYKYSAKTNLYTAYYNDPEELSGQVSQEVYIRTNIDEDFSIKLIMEGKKQFNTFQPVFFSMIKSFKFGNSLF
jgi:hypothetical protein